MSITLDFPPDLEARLNKEAAGEGLDLAVLVRQMLENDLARKEIAALKTPDGQHWDYARLLALPQEEQNRIMERAAREAAPLYAADLALPHHLRELTAFEAINDPIYDSPADYFLPKSEEITSDNQNAPSK